MGHYGEGAGKGNYLVGFCEENKLVIRGILFTHKSINKLT